MTLDCLPDWPVIVKDRRCPLFFAFGHTQMQTAQDVFRA